MQNVYSAIDLVMLTSKNEGTPVALIEAMACGKVVMSTKVGGVEDFIVNGENGFYFEENEIALFVERIKHWLNYPEQYKEIRKSAETSALKQFSLKGLLERTDNLVTKLYNEKGMI